MAINMMGYNNWMSYLSPIVQGLQNNYPNTYAAYGGVGSAGGFSNALWQAQNASANLNVPQSMDAIFDEASAAYNLPDNLLKAIGKAESDYNPNCVSGAGAQGVMQLMPSTAQYLGVENPFDVRQNIFGGAKYIAEMLNRFGGDVELALAAYNAGPNAVEKYGGIPPYTETQNYVRKVTEYMGQTLTTGQTVNVGSGYGAGNPALYGNGMMNTCTCACCQGNSLLGTGSSQEDALYLLELMKLQMQTSFLNGGLMGGNDSGGGLLL